MKAQFEAQFCLCIVVLGNNLQNSLFLTKTSVLGSYSRIVQQWPLLRKELRSDGEHTIWKQSITIALYRHNYT